MRSAAVGNETQSEALKVIVRIFFPSLQAAIAGLGVVMGRNVLVKQDLDAGVLVEPFSTRLVTDSGYYLSLSATAERERRPAVTACRDWLLKAVQETMAERRSNRRPQSIAF